MRTLFKGHTSTTSACRTAQDMNDANESSSSTMATAHPTNTFFKHAVTLGGGGGIRGGQSVAFAHPLSLSHFLPRCKNRSLGHGLGRNCFATSCLLSFPPFLPPLFPTAGSVPCTAPWQQAETFHSALTFYQGSLLLGWLWVLCAGASSEVTFSSMLSCRI